MKKVSVKFFKEGRWAVSLEKQIEVKEGEVVPDLPIIFAHIVVDAGRGEMVEEETVVEDEDDKVETPDPKSQTELYALNMNDLREVGNEYEVKGNSSDALIAKILEAQTYTEEYLDVLDDIDIVAIGEAKEITEEADIEDLVNAILDSQKDDE